MGKFAEKKDNVLRIELTNAIKSQEFILHYQPQYNLATSCFEGVEALIRWQHPTKGLLLPTEFIPEAERYGLIEIIGEWVLKTACAQNKAWQDKGLPHMRIAVNIMQRQLKQKNFVESVIKILNKIKLKPKYLELEINENTIINEDDEKLIQIINRLKKLGVQIALDDFGTGFSSIKYLKKFPIDRIKIDKTYIENMLTDSNDAAIVHAMITLAKSMNLQILAEGVETLKQLQMLSSQESIEVQGFYFSEPVPAEEIEGLILQHLK